jgi:hypothetical protein
MVSTQTPEWHYEYLPYTVTETDGSERELPNFRIFPIDEPENYIAETNEHLPGDVQEAHALLITAAPDLFDALEYFFNTMHDYQSSVRKGYVKFALDKARAAIAKAKPRKAKGGAI